MGVDVVANNLDDDGMIGTDAILVNGRDAVLSDDLVYRYWLHRWVFDGDGGCVTWVMLNPSTADANVDDATIRKCMAFTKLWGHSSMVVINLFAFRSTDPKGLKTAADPVGPENDEFLAKWMAGSEKVVVAWGAHGSLLNRDKDFVEKHSALASRFQCLGTTKSGAPKHPLYIPYTQPLLPWSST